jgi:hypothetical protein
MDPTGEIRPPVQVEQKPTTISQYVSTTDSKQDEAITQEQPTKYSEERKALGLKEERTLQEIAQEKDRQRKEAVESYLSYRKSEKKTKTPPTFEDILKQGREKAKSVLDVLSTREKAEIAVRRAKALAIMTAKGIRNPERVLQILEAEAGNDSELRYINLEDMRKNDSWSTYERKKAVSAFHSIYERAQSNEFINGCLEIGDVLTVWERMQQMGARFSLNNIGRKDAEQLIPMFQKLARIPSEQFSTMLDDLRQYSFLFPDRIYSVEDNLAFEPLVEFIASNTQISAEQRQVLETAKRIYQIGEPGSYGYRDFHPILSKHDPFLLLSNRERLSDELIVLEQLVLDLYDPRVRAGSYLDSHWKQKYLYEKNTYVFGQIDKLAQAGDLHTLAELIRNGFTIGADHARVFIDEYRIDEGKLNAVQEDIRRSAELLTRFSDKTLLSEVLFIEDLRQSEDPGYEVLSIGRSRFFESLLRERSSSQDALQVAMNIVNKLTDDPAKRVHLLNRFVLFDDDLGVDLNVDNLLFELKSPDVLDKLSQEDRLFWRQIFDWREHKFRGLGKPNNFVLLFFIRNQSRFNEFYQGGRLTDTFFNEFTSFFGRLPDKYFTDYIDETYISSINGFLLDPKQAPPSIEGLAKALTTLETLTTLNSTELQSIYAILGTDYGKWSSLITDGRPNINLISLVLENSQEVNIANKLLTAEVITQLPEEQRTFWSVWKDVVGCSKEMSMFLYKNRGRFADFYQDKHLTPAFLEEFYKDAFSKGTQVDLHGLNMLIRNGFLDNFPRTYFAIWQAINQVNVSYPSIRFAVEHLSEIKGYFNEKGEPNTQLLVYLAKGGAVDLQQAFLSDELLNTFNETEQVFWREWRNLPYEGKIIFNQKLTDNPQITEDLLREIKIFNTLFREIEQSPSQKLKKIKDQLISLLLESSQPEQVLRKVRELFERNNLPDFAEKFKIFEILYFTPEIDGKTRFDREMEEKGERLSPILRRASRLRRLDTIYKDLLRISIDSGDISLRNYLAAMQEGQVLLAKVDSEGIESLTPEEKIKLTRVLNRLNVLYENSLLARIRGKSATPLSDDISLEARITSLRNDLEVKEGQTIIDQVFEMFVKPLGYESIDEVLARMDSIKEQVHKRNLSNPRVQEGQLEINAGDLLKGIEDDVLGYILQSGLIAREYIGVNADSDTTPFDTDTGMVLQEDLEGGLPHVISSSPAKEYGNLIIVVRNRGQFIRTDQQESVNLQYNPKNYELFYSGEVDKRHFGVRTGIPSTEIDAIILTGPLLDENQNSTLRREQIFFNIANNGFYIPVVNPEGKVIFTEEDYNRYRLDGQRIQEAINQGKFSPSEFIDILKECPYLKKLYEMSYGVREGYSTEQHTQMVMNQFEKYFSADFKSTFLTRGDFRLMLALHDIGKPLSVYATGSTSAQHEYTKRVLTYALQVTGIPPQKVDTIISLVDQDILGEYFTGKIDRDTAVDKIKDLSLTLGVLPNELINVLRIFYICDAGSYTADAGGVPSLDYLFRFDPQNGTASFSDEVENKYQELLRRLI